MMNPISPESYKGILFVQMEMLPPEQKLKLREWLPAMSTINILKGNVLINECVTYSDYTYWYQNCFTNFDYLENQL